MLSRYPPTPAQSFSAPFDMATAAFHIGRPRSRASPAAPRRPRQADLQPLDQAHDGEWREAQTEAATAGVDPPRSEEPGRRGCPRQAPPPKTEGPVRLSVPPPLTGAGPWGDRLTGERRRAGGWQTGARRPSRRRAERGARGAFGGGAAGATCISWRAGRTRGSRCSAACWCQPAPAPRPRWAAGLPRPPAAAAAAASRPWRQGGSRTPPTPPYLPTHLSTRLPALPSTPSLPRGSVLTRRARREDPRAPGARGGANAVPSAGPYSPHPPAGAAVTRQQPPARSPSKSSGGRLAP